jgi:hypothetical protein
MNSEQFVTEQKKQSYLTKMRLIESHMKTLLENFDAITREDYQMISGEIARLLQVAESCVNIDPMLDNVTMVRGNPDSNNYNLWNMPQNEPQLIDLSEFNANTNTLGENEQLMTGTVYEFDDLDSLFDDDLASSFDDYMVESDQPMTVSELDATSLVQNDQPMTVSELDATSLVQDDQPMTVSELDATSLVEGITEFGCEEEYQEYISNKIRPRLTAKSYSKKDTIETIITCTICMEENDLPSMVTLNCEHTFCTNCICMHFHHSVETQPYQQHYGCPLCRAKVTKVRVNYSRYIAKNVDELMNGLYVPDFLKILCKYK